MKKRVLAVIVATMVFSSSLTAFAAPGTTIDGTLFDAAYYAQQYPDVVAVYGTNPDALYSHYVNHGRAEGRRCYMAATYDTAFNTTYYAQQHPVADNTAFDATYYAQQYYNGGYHMMRGVVPAPYTYSRGGWGCCHW